MTGHPSLRTICRDAHARYVGEPVRVGYGGHTLVGLARMLADRADSVGALREYAEAAGLLLTDGLEPEAIDLTDHPDYADALAVLRAGA